MLEFLFKTMLPERDHPRDATLFAGWALLFIGFGAKLIGWGVG